MHSSWPSLSTAFSSNVVAKKIANKMQRSAQSMSNSNNIIPIVDSSAFLLAIYEKKRTNLRIVM